MSLKSFLQKVVPGREAEQLHPPLLTSVIRFPYGAYKFKAHVAKGVSCQIQASTNLKNWMDLADLVSSGEIDYVDTNAPNFSHRFYRLNAGGLLSQNIIGYASISAPPGFSMISNSFASADNTVAELLKAMPDGTSLSKFNASVSNLTENKVQRGKWTSPNERLAPGEGALFYNPTSDYKTLDFFGDVKRDGFSIPIPAGFSVRSSPVPQPGRLDTDLGFPLTPGDVIHLFDKDSQKYVLYPYDETWAANPPILSVGESFWVAKETARNWTQPPVPHP